MSNLFACTITRKVNTTYYNDKVLLQEALQFLETQGAYSMQMHLEVQPDKGHLLHLHGIIHHSKKIEPYTPKGICNKYGVNYKFEKIYDLAGWKTYCSKSPIDPEWVWNQYHVNLFSDEYLHQVPQVLL